MGDPPPPPNPGLTESAVPPGPSGTATPAAPVAPAAKAAQAAPVEKLAALWARVKEHKVIQWGLAYLGAALALAHGAELTAHALHWPDIVPRIFVIVLWLGLPVAVTCAWYHGARGLKHVSGAELTIISLLMLLGAGFLWVFVRPGTEHQAEPVPAAIQEAAAPATTSSAATSAPASQRAKPRIAILPFENLSPDPANAFFADGLHEEILSALASRARDLEVISRTTMMLYRAQPKPVAEIARELGASHLLEGSVRREGDHVRLTLQLIDAGSDGHLWSQNYDRKLVKAMTLQSEVASEVAAQLSVELLRGAEAKAPTANPEAYDLYLKGRLARQLLSGAATTEAWREVESLFGEAIAQDPSFALAYAERASVRFFMFITNYDTSAESLARARADVETARRLARGAPVTLAAESIAALIDQDYDRALSLFEAAEAAGLSDPNMLVWKSNILLERDQGFDVALRILAEAAALDPGNPYVFSIWTGILTLAQQPAEAIRVMSIARARQPDNLLWRDFSTAMRASFTAEVPQDEASRLEAEYKAFIAEGGIPSDQIIASAFAGALLDFPLPQRVLVQDRGRLPETLRVAQIATFFPFSVGRMPTAAFLGWSHLVAGDLAAAAKDGAAVQAFVAAQDETKWNRWFLHLLSAEAHVFRGERAAAEREAREALKHVSAKAHYTNWRFANYKAAQVLAWTGAKEEAVTMLEQLNGPGGLAPAFITRDRIFTIPLADNARYRALKAKLEAQMAATKLE